MLFLHIFTSLDGYIEDENGSIEWFRESDDFDQYIVKLLGSIDGMVFGRVAHDLLAEYWPTAADRRGARPNEIEMARLMNALPKYVLTRSGRCAGWNNSRPVDVEGIVSLKQKAQRDIALFAGAGAAQCLVEKDLVDAIQLLVNPVLLGGGKTLFAGGGARRNLRLTDTKPLNSGVIMLGYVAEDR